MIKTIRKYFILRHPRLRNFIVLGKLYLTHPDYWIPLLKSLIRRIKARRIGVTIIKPKDTYIFFNIFDSTSNVIDVGCGHDAEFSQYLINKYGLKAYGVDPTAKHGEALNKLEEKTNGKFKHINLAITSEEGEIPFYETLDHESGSIHTDHKNIIADRIRSYTVKTKTITGLVQYLDLKSVDLIKLDLENAEYELFNKIDLDDLKSFRQIYIEFHHHALKRYTKEDTKQIVNKIRSVGFESFSLEDNNYLFYNFNY